MAIRFKNLVSTGNGGDGVRIEGNPDVEIDELTTADNGGDGLNIIQDQAIDAHEKRWFEKPFGIVLLGIAVTVVGGGILKYLGWL